MHGRAVQGRPAGRNRLANTESDASSFSIRSKTRWRSYGHEPRHLRNATCRFRVQEVEASGRLLRLPRRTTAAITSMRLVSENLFEIGAVGIHDMKSPGLSEGNVMLEGNLFSIG